MKICPKCGNEHDKIGTFCSRSCANSRGPRNEEFKNAVSKKLSGRRCNQNDHINKGKHLVERLKRFCLECECEFTTTQSENKVYCSNDCRKKNSGGYREGSGRAKTGYYKGIYCGSTYELVWVIYQLDHGKEFSRFDGFLENNGVKYFPDFLQNNRIVEIKGYESIESVAKKTEVANSNGYDVIVLRKDDLIVEFEWVFNKYGTNLPALYDGYKPNYKYTCVCCNKEFETDKKKKTENVFCSRYCSGKGHVGRKTL